MYSEKNCTGNTDHTLTSLGSNVNPRDEKSPTNHLKHGTVSLLFTNPQFV